MAIAIAMHSCEDVETGPKIGMQQYEINKTANKFGDKFDVIQIDSCEYIYSSLFTREGLLTHKGNCKNPIHIYNK